MTDEISFTSIDLLAALEQTRLVGVRLLVFGDFRQLTPVCHRWRGQKVPHDLFARNRLFHRLSEGTRSAPSVRSNTVRHMPEAQGPGHAIGYLQGPRPLPSYWRVVRLAHLRVPSQAEAPQRPNAEAPLPSRPTRSSLQVTFCECFPGTKLIGTNSTLKPIVNAAFLLLTRALSDTLWIEDEALGGDGFELSVSSLVKHIWLRRALMLCSLQGRPLNDTLAMHDANLKRLISTWVWAVRPTVAKC